MTRYLSCTETAKLIRQALKGKFPGVKFSVKSQVYSGGASINVSWVDGPAAALVDAVAKSYEGAGFDGMIDMKFNKYAYLMPDGTAVFAQTSGTEGSGGMVSAGKAFKPCAEAERVSFGADYVFTRRNYSRGFIERIAGLFCKVHGLPVEAIEIREWHDGSCHADMKDWEQSQMWHRFLARRMIAA